MSTVDKVIYDALVKRRNVVLPGIGSLEVKRRKAKKVSDTRIIPPQNVVVFTTDELAEAETAVYLLTAEGISEDEARTLYESWLEGARSEDGVDIENVGEIRDGKFVAAQSLHIALNPDREEVVYMEKENRGGGGPIWPWILAGLLLALIIFFLFKYCGDGFPCIKKKPKAVVETVATVPPSEPVVEKAPTSEEIIAETLKKQVEPRFHIIAGSFSVEANADNYIKRLKAEFPDLKPEKIKSSKSGNWLVSIFKAPTERQAYNRMSMYWDVNLNIWVYEEK